MGWRLFLPVLPKKAAAVSRGSHDLCREPARVHDGGNLTSLFNQAGEFAKVDISTYV